ncbi:MAG: NAD(P)H-dependent oxidoreductase [Pseudomonadales bacterium]
MSTLNVLRIDASARGSSSVSRTLTGRLVGHFAEVPGVRVVHRDLGAAPPPMIDEHWVAANFTDAAERSSEQRATLAGSDALVAELKAADLVVLGAPIYNFSIPAVLKGWIDLVARARETFRYTEQGPEGLLKGKRAVLIIASGGTRVGSAGDFASDYLRHLLAFMGIEDVTTVAADGHLLDPERIGAAERAIDELAGTLLRGVPDAPATAD